MNKLFLNLLDFSFLLVAVSSGFYMVMQLLMLVLSLNIKRILAINEKSAYAYYSNVSYIWKNPERVMLLLQGPGTTRLRKIILMQAKREIRERVFLSHDLPRDLCMNCIFQFNCDDKYYIRCKHCRYAPNCSILKTKRSLSICENFKCARWIEKD